MDILLLFQYIPQIIHSLVREMFFPPTKKKREAMKVDFTKEYLLDNIGCIVRINKDIYIDLWKTDGFRIQYTTKDCLVPRWAQITSLVDFLNTTFGGREVQYSQEDM